MSPKQSLKKAPLAWRGKKRVQKSCAISSVHHAFCEMKMPEMVPIKAVMAAKISLLHDPR